MEDGLSSPNSDGDVDRPEPQQVRSPEEARALLATYYTADFRRLVALTRSRFSSLDGEDAVQDLYCKILDGVDRCSAIDLSGYVYRWTQPPFVTRSLVNACLDRLGSATRRREEVRDFAAADAVHRAGAASTSGHEGDPGAPAAEPEAVPARLDALHRQTAIRTLVQVLYERGKRPTKRPPYLSERQLQTLVALYDSGPTADADEPMDDLELHELALHQNMRARERWRDQHGRSDPEHGSLTAAAARLGVSKQAVSKSQQSSSASLALLHYVAGVLAPERALLDPDAVHRSADAFDELGGQTGLKDHHRRLGSAASAVGTTTRTGTRVQADRLAAVAGESPDETLTGLHHAERSLAEQARTPHPNCVTVCSPHNPRRNRVTEVYL